MQTIDKVINILEVLLAEPELSASEIAARIDMPVPTTHRILSSLTAKGILEKDMRSKRYCLGWALVRYAKNVRTAGEQKYDLKRIHPIMQNLSSAFGETVTLAACTGTRVTLIKVIDGTNPLRHCSEEGAPMPLHAAAPSKILVAYQPEKLRARFLRAVNFERYTENTISDMPTYLKSLEAARRDGVAFCENELTPHCLAVSVPIFNKKGEVILALTVVGYIDRITQCYDDVLEKLRASAKEIEDVLY